jgi:hypothetical protein
VLTSNHATPVRATAHRRCVLLLIDVEPDLRKAHGAQGGSEGTQKALSHLAAFRRQLEEVTGIRVEFNWFVRADPQVSKIWGRANWVADACPQLIETIERHGDYCGIHLHLWRWNARRGEWFNEFNDSGWAAECLRVSIGAFQQIFHRPPEACRFGDRWLNQNAVELLQVSGIRFDLTIEPGLPDEPVFDDPHATGWLPDYRAAPREPYRPSSGNFLAPEREAANRSPLWMIPLTTTSPAWRLVRRPPYLLKASRSPNLSLRSSYVWPHLRTQLDLRTSAPLVIVLRTGDLGRGYFVRNFLRTTRQLLKHAALPRCEFTNPPTAVARWEAPR